MKLTHILILTAFLVTTLCVQKSFSSVDLDFEENDDDADEADEFLDRERRSPDADPEPARRSGSRRRSYRAPVVQRRRRTPVVRKPAVRRTVPSVRRSVPKVKKSETKKHKKLRTTPKTKSRRRSSGIGGGGVVIVNPSYERRRRTKVRTHNNYRYRPSNSRTTEQSKLIILSLIVGVLTLLHYFA